MINIKIENTSHGSEETGVRFCDVSSETAKTVLKLLFEDQSLEYESGN